MVAGKGKLTHTGQLGEVMQESIQAAMTVVRSRAAVLGLDPDFYQKADVHIHVPEGATPKDGPSAGIGMCTALVSALTKAPVRSDVATDNLVPEPPFWGTRVVTGIPLDDYAGWLDEGALFKGQWGLKGARSGQGPSYEELVETEGRPRLRRWLARLRETALVQAAVVYGYFPCVAKGDDLIVLAAPNGDRASGAERTRFTFPRQRRGRRLCLADFFRSEESGEIDVVGLQVVTVGSEISAATAQLFADDSYRDYLELHGLWVQLAEALAEFWHASVRAELGFGSTARGSGGPGLGEPGRATVPSSAIEGKSSGSPYGPESSAIVSVPGSGPLKMPSVPSSRLATKATSPASLITGAFSKLV